MFVKHLTFGTRVCSQCRRGRPRAGGEEVVYNGGLNARWICAGCALANIVREVAA